MSELPHGWTSKQFFEVLDFKGGSQPPKSTFSQEHGLGLVRLLQIRDFASDEKAVYIKDSAGWPKCAADDIMVGRYGASVGRILTGKSGAYNVALVKIIIDETKALKLFIYRWLHTSTFQDKIHSISRSAQNGFNKADFEDLEIVIPPISEQRRIVAKLDSLTTRTGRAREQLDRIPNLILKYREAILEAAFSGELTKEWRAARRLPESPINTLGSVASEFSYGSAAKSSPTGKIPVLRMGNIQDGSLDWEDLVYTSDQKEISKYKLTPGDVLFNRTNSPALVGKTALYRDERPAIYAGYLIRIRCAEHLIPEFLTYCLNSPAGRTYCWQVKTDGVSQSNINAKKLAAFKLPLPTLPEQQEIVRRIETAFVWLDRVATEHANASRLLPKLDQAILTKAFQGELVPQDPNDKPVEISTYAIAESPSRRGRIRRASN